MALQGDIQSIAFPDVLRLLADTSKTGRVTLTGQRGEGEVRFREGAIVGGETSAAPNAEEPLDVVFELMRFEDGTFCFDEMAIDDDREPVDVAGLLTVAETMLAEWRAIGPMGPTADTWLSFAPELDRDQVVVSRGDWQVLGALREGCPMHELGDRVAMTELSLSRVVHDLIELGLVLVGEERPAAVEPWTVDEPWSVDDDVRPAASVLYSVPDHPDTVEDLFEGDGHGVDDPLQPSSTGHRTLASLPEPLPGDGGTSFELGGSSPATSDLPDGLAQAPAESSPMTDVGDRPSDLGEFLGSPVGPTEDASPSERPWWDAGEEPDRAGELAYASLEHGMQQAGADDNHLNSSPHAEVTAGQDDADQEPAEYAGRSSLARFLASARNS